MRIIYDDAHQEEFKEAFGKFLEVLKEAGTKAFVDEDADGGFFNADALTSLLSEFVKDKFKISDTYTVPYCDERFKKFAVYYKTENELQICCFFDLEDYCGGINRSLDIYLTDYDDNIIHMGGTFDEEDFTITEEEKDEPDEE